MFYIKRFLVFAVFTIAFLGASQSYGAHSAAAGKYVADLKSANPEVRWDAVEALGELKEPSTVAPLIEALRDPALAPAFINEMRRAILKAVDASSMEILIGALGDESAVVRECAADGLAKIEDPATVVPLIEALSDRKAAVRRSASAALDRKADHRAFDKLIYVLRDPDDTVRYNAAEGLGRIGDEKAIEPLIKALADEFWGTRVMAATSLALFDDRRVVMPILLSLEEADDMGIEEELAHIIVALDVEGTADDLIYVLDNIFDTNNAVMSVLIGILGERGERKAVDALIRLLEKKDAVLRYDAVESLGMIEDRRAVMPLMGLASDKSWGVRAVVMDSLGTLGDERAAPAIEAATGDEIFMVRVSAVKALVTAGDERAVGILIGMLSDEEELVADVASESLALLTGEDFGVDGEKWAYWHAAGGKVCPRGEC